MKARQREGGSSSLAANLWLLGGIRRKSEKQITDGEQAGVREGSEENIHLYFFAFGTGFLNPALGSLSWQWAAASFH